MYGIDSYRLGVRNNSFHHPQFDLNSSWLYFFEKVFIYVKERLFLKWYKGRKWFFPSLSIWSKSVSNNISEKKNSPKRVRRFWSTTTGLGGNREISFSWITIFSFFFIYLFIYLFIFCAIFQLLVLAIFGAGAIFQLLVLAIFSNFSEDSFLALFSASGLSNFWRGRHFSASGLSNFWRFFGGFVFATQRRFLPKLKVCPSSVSSTNPLAQNSKLENNTLDNTSLLLKSTEGIICYFTASLVVLSHVFFFLIYLFLLSCIFNIFFEFWRWFERFVHVNWLNKI